MTLTDDRRAAPDPETLRRALDGADLRVLLMVVHQLTGDRRWLRPPFTPRRDVRLIADEGAGLSPAAADELRAAALELLLDDRRGGPAVVDPDDDLLVELMTHCMGEDIPREYAPMFRKEMGFASDLIERAADAPPIPPDRDVLIVGAGVSGLALGHQLDLLGIPYEIVDKNESVGGTWFENRYPGCGVDTPNHAYSLSYTRHFPWTSYFSPRDDIQAYLERTADDLDVRRHVRTGTEVVAAAWDDERHRWFVTTRDVRTGAHETRDVWVLVSAVGQLNLPFVPDLPGLDEFTGEVFHSSRWPDELDLTGRRVAVVGTGASSMQIVPTIADEVAALTVYQRTPQWARPIPRYHDRITDEMQWLLEHVPYYAAWTRFTMFWRYGDGLLPFLRRDPDWPYPERAMNRVNDRHRQEMVDHLTAELGARTNLVDACTPDYPPYGKRILLDNGWYRTLARDHVELVADRVDRLTPAGVVAADGIERPADVVVLATGFQVTKMAARLGITGRGGRDLAGEWGDDPKAHLGISIAGYPNLFSMLGPTTSLGHGGSAMFQSECQARYIAASLIEMLDRRLDAIEVRPEVQDAYIARYDAAHAELIWTHPGVETYYRNSAGRVYGVMPWRLVDYFHMTRWPDLDEFVQTPTRSVS